MLNYLSRDARSIRANVPEGTSIPPAADDLFVLYAVLMRAKGVAVQAEDVHDAWAAWMTTIDPGHESIVPFDTLDDATKAEDLPFLRAIRAVAAARVEHHSSGTV